MKPTLPELLPLVAAYKSRLGNGCGGSLHIVLADGNVADKDVHFCLQWAITQRDTEGEVLAEKLLKASKTQRLKIYRAFHGMPYPEDCHSREEVVAYLKQSLAKSDH